MLVCVVAATCALDAAAAEGSDQAKAEQSFSALCKQWVETLNSYSRNNIVCTQQPDGMFVAEYTVCSDKLEMEVKPTASKACFVGKLRYCEQKYRNCAKTREEAVRGPFTLAAETNVTQLFLYRNGGWQY